MYEFILYIIGLLLASVIGYVIGKGSLPGKRSTSPPSSHAPPSTIAPPPEPHFIPPQPLSALATTTSGRRRRLILVAKQLPITCTRLDNGEWSIEWEDSRSFLSNLRVLRQYMDVKWVGSPGVEVPRDEQDEFEELLGQHDCIPVFLPKDLAERFFNGFCKGVLWPLLHYVMPQSQQDFGKKWDSLWQAYTSATFLYASVVTRSVENPTDSIWIHNYHLLLLPSALRPRLPRAKIGLFIHTPFPSSDVFRLLPSRHNILSSIMCSDLIGFHTFDYARHFLSCTKRVLDLDFETMAGGLLGVKNAGRFVSILISHVGIESREFREAAQSQWVASRVEEIVSKFAGRRIIIGVDDLDLVKGSLLKLQAYERFLTNHEEWRDQVVLIEILLPSSTAQSEKKAVRESLMNEISSIRQQFGPNVIEVIERDNIDFKEMVALFNASQVAVVSTFWDGLNLTPYEYTASQSMVNPGALVVSEFMGCSRSLTGVFRVNPWGLEMVADAIHQALQLSLEERRAHHQRRFAYVMNHTIEQWGRGFLENLDRATQMSSGLTFMQVGWGSNVKLVGLRSDFRHLDEDTVTRAYRNCNQRILLLDYDGTLTPNVATRSKLVGPSPEILDCLRLLAEEPNTVVFIMSGRKRSSLGAWFKDIPELGLAAEKGCFLRWPKKLAATCRQDHGISSTSTTTPKDITHVIEKKKKVKIDEPEEKIESYDDDDDELDPSEWETMVPDDDDSWKQTALEVLRAYTVQTDGSWIEDKEFACVWHYENADPEYGRMQASDLSKYLVKVLANPGIDVVRYDNNRILEVKPKGVNKGLAATAILEAVVNNKDPISPFILCVGDDRSDEDMFEAVQNRDDLITQPQGGVRNLKRLMHMTSNRTLQKNSTKLSFMNDENDKHDENKEEEKTNEKKVDPHTFTCCVGIRPSAASYYLHDEIEVINIVHALATCSRYIQTYHSGQNSPHSSYAPLSPTSLPDPHSIPTQASTSSSHIPTTFASLKPSLSSGNKLSSGVKASLSGGSLNLRNRRTGNLAAMVADMSDED